MEIRRKKSESLKLVFQLAPASEPVVEFKAGDAVISTQLRSGAIPDAEAIAIIVETMQSLDIPIDFFFRDKNVSIPSLLRSIKKRGGVGNPLETSGLYFHLGVVASMEHCFILIKETVPGAAKDWDRWAASFIEHSAFVQAFVVDTEYNYWQNAKAPLQYEAEKQDFSNLPMRWNGLPSPLGAMEIDTTRNPGRWSLEVGYIEAIAATMWFSQAFWDRVGEDRRQRLSDSGFVLRRVANGVDKLVAYNAPFDDESTSEIQNRLRMAIYGR
jgi:hypothetical protein